MTSTAPELPTTSGAGFSSIAGPHRVPLELFLAEVSPLEWYRDWGHALDVMCSNRHERRIIDHLAADLAAKRRFREPLRVEDGELGNGYHRLSATVVAAAAGLETPAVDVWVVDDAHPYPRSDDNYPVLELSFVIDAPRLHPDERDDAFFSLSRSLRLDDHTWAEADVVSARFDTYTVSYMDLTEDRVRDVRDALHAAVAPAGITVTLCGVTTYHIDDLDD